MSRKMRDLDWELNFEPRADGSVKSATTDRIQAALLMDIRRELKTLNNLLGCSNALAIPKILRQIARNTSRAKCRGCPLTFETQRGLAQHVRRAHS